MKQLSYSGVLHHDLHIMIIKGVAKLLSFVRADEAERLLEVLRVWGNIVKIRESA